MVRAAAVTRNVIGALISLVLPAAFSETRLFMERCMKQQTWVTRVLVALFVGTSALLFWHNLTLRAKPSSASASPFIKVGANIQGVELVDANGNEVLTSFDKAHTKYLA